MRKFIDTNVAVLLAIAIFVRLLGIATRPTWYDEAFSILFSEKGLGAMLYGTLAPTGGGSADIHPLGYYTLLWLWMKVFGESLVIVRLFSIISGVISVYLIYRIGLEALNDQRTAFLGALFAALAPFQIHYSQEIRMYSLMTMWVLLATYASQRGSKTSGWTWWALFAFAAALAQYTHHLAAFFLIALALLPILQKDWKTWRRLVAACIGALILYAPWAIQLPAQFSKVQHAYWVTQPDVSKFFTLLIVYITNTPLPNGFVAAAFFITLIVVIIGFIQTMRTTQQSRGKNGLWLLYLSFAPPLFLFLFSQWRPVYIERALLPSGAIFCIWLAWVINNTDLAKPIQYLLLAMLGASSLFGIYEHVTYYDFPYGPFQTLDTALRARLQPGDVVIHSNKLTMLPAMLFDRGLPQQFVGDVPGSSGDTLAPATQQVLGIKAQMNIESATKDAQRVWYVIYRRAIDEYGDRKVTYPDFDYLSSQFNLQSTETWDGLQVFLYVKKS
jgi:4-amino-4-deoxy-L-arabinose transferase-like glycosyltransferase